MHLINEQEFLLILSFTKYPRCCYAVSIDLKHSDFFYSTG